jgi:DNA (cytosine-5)-methyltransferase 3A
MNVLSLFDGMSCGRIALERLGIKVDNYYASEIDKYAIQVSQANYPDIIQVGDITELDLSTLPKIDLIMGGSPCQGFSFAGKQLAFDDPRSALFFEFVRCVEVLKPKYFLLENVRMKKEYLDVISEYMGVEPIMINSALVSAQNRVRYYWTNIPGVEQPKDRGMVLKDILEDGFDSERDKSYCIDANYYKGASVEQYKKKCRRQLVNKTKKEYISKQSVEKYVEDVNAEFNDPYNKKKVKGDKSTTLRTNSSNGNMWVNDKAIKIDKEKKQRTMIPTDVDSKYYLSDKAIDYMNRGSEKYTGKKTRAEHYIKHESEKSKTLTANMHKGVPYGVIAVDSYREVRTEEAKRLRKEMRQKTGKDHTPFRAKKLVPREDGKVGTLTTSLTNDHKISLTKEKEVYWRKLTPVECERLQTVPDNYTNHVSNTQRYKMLGNGWTIEVITHILKNMEL